ncbi:hypothetical protein C5167_009200, partial [Papaver somniferum]
MSLKFTSTIIIIGSPKKNLVMDFTDVSNSLEAFVKAKQGNKGDHFTTFRKDVMLPLTGFMSNNPQQSNRFVLLYRSKLWLDPANVNVKEVICPLGCLLGAT